jgi:hypothetical protein
VRASTICGRSITASMPAMFSMASVVPSTKARMYSEAAIVAQYSLMRVLRSTAARA